ncbi:MAG: triacylglycerol lipase, partial [Bacilli bacterium]|nr:triacylglycerol lipase [Bacilli bacterium]
METRYPIILVHGLAVRDCIFMKPFGQIERILKIQGHKVFRSKIESFAPIEHNAEVLKQEILKLEEEYGVDKVNIVAHSKG